MGAKLVTGATGLVGGALLPRLLRREPATRIYCLIRARSPEELGARRQALLAELGIPADDAARVRAVAGNVTSSGLGLEEPEPIAEEIDEIYHAAASTRFDMRIGGARRFNVRGTRNALELAELAQRRGGFRRFHHVSTAYVGWLDERGERVFRNAYEQSKWEAEAVVRDFGQPFTIYRPSIIMGDSQTGWTPHFRVLYEPMKWIYLSKTTILPAEPEFTFDVVPVDYVCDALLEIGSQAGSAGGVYHLTCGHERAVQGQRLVDLSMEAGNAYMVEIGEPTREGPTVVPFEAVAAETPEEREQLEGMREFVRAMTRAYLPYLGEQQLFDDPETREALAGSGIECPSPDRYFPILVRYGLQRDFGVPSRFPPGHLGAVPRPGLEDQPEDGTPRR